MHTSKRLIAVNIALLGTLGVVTLATASRSTAQPAPVRPRGEYTLISGRFQGSTTSAVYILDAANQEFVALQWDRNKNRFEVIGYRSLTGDAQQFRGAR